MQSLNGFYAAALAGTFSLLSPVAALATTTSISGQSLSISTYQPSLALTPLIQTGGNYYDIGTVRWSATNFAPEGYQIANGATLSISGNDTLFSRLGTVYGGDGRTTFRLPDLRGRAILGASTATIGQTNGAPSYQLSVDNLPSHSHAIPANALTNDADTSATGAGTPLDMSMPTLDLRATLSINGVYPSPNSTVGSSDFLGKVDYSAAYFAIDPRAEGIEADGTILPIAQNAALFSLLGTMYGGDGRSTFGVPDIDGKLVVGAGTGPGLSNVNVGQTSGAQDGAVTLTVPNLPNHVHEISDGDPGTADVATTLASGPTAPFENRQESLGMSYYIAIMGTYPSQTASPYSSPSIEPFLGEIGLFAGNFGTAEWVKAEGQILSIAQHSALFSLLGTTFGGDGQTTFALPDLRGRTAIGAGTTAWGDFLLGQRTGEEMTLLTTGTLAAHDHTVTLAPPTPAVPLPAPIALLGAGLFSFGALRKFRRTA